MKFRKRSFLAGASILGVFGLVIGIAGFGYTQSAQAAELIKDASQQVVIPKPGQIAHYTSRIFSRVPPSNFEPSDPYHLPYSQIWREWQVEQVWLEVSPKGVTSRWRTQLYSDSGELLQDLVFDGVQETDYFPSQGLATTLDTKSRLFKDDRQALFDLLLKEPRLSQREAIGIDGKPTLSIDIKTYEIGVDQQGTVEGDLLAFRRPFLADLQPVRLVHRIDFDPEKRIAIGEAQSVYDSAGTEYIVYYKTSSDPEILTEVGSSMFALDLPVEITVNSDTAGLITQESLTDLPKIAQQINIPIYVLDKELLDLRLVSVDYTLPKSDSNTLPSEYRAINFASMVGFAVRTVYISNSSDAQTGQPNFSLTLLQGPKDTLSASLRATRPLWLNSYSDKFTIDEQIFWGWELVGFDDKFRHYVIELPASLIYIESTGMADEQVRTILGQLSIFKN